MKKWLRDGRCPGLRVVLLAPPSHADCAVALMAESSPVTVAGAAPALHRLPVHRIRVDCERTERGLYTDRPSPGVPAMAASPRSGGDEEDGRREADEKCGERVLRGQADAQRERH